MQAVGIVNTKICDIGPGNDNLFLKGIILRKQESKLIYLKRDNSERCVWNFTLRDSPKDLINVNAWGSPTYIRDLSLRWKIGDIVDVLNVKAVFRKFSNDDDLYQPSVSCSFSVVFSEGQSDIRLSSSHELLPLMRTPIKSADAIMIITDIHSNGEKLKKQYVNVLGAVHNIGMERRFTSKDGRNILCKNITLIDETYETITLTIWNEDLIAISESWVERDSILFLVDVRVEWNDFRKAITLSTTGRTVIIENPLMTKADNLKKFLTSEPFRASGKLDHIINKYGDLSIINTVMSCSKIILKSKTEKKNEFTALLYGLINNFNIDGSDNIVVTKCMRCQWRVDPFLELCLNANCPSGAGNAAPSTKQVYDIRISLTDHTGCLMNCKITHETAMKLIKYEPAHFHSLKEEEKTFIKWKYLLKYCAVKLVVLPLSGKDVSIITVMSLDVISLTQFSSLVPMY